MPTWKRSRPAPRTAPGRPRNIADDVTWTRTVEPRERYRIVYQGNDGQQTIREITLCKLGHSQERQYAAVIHDGKPKTFRLDHILQVLEQLTTGHASSLVAAITYRTVLPPWPVAGAVFKAQTITASTRSWTVDLNAYTCTCPEKRIRSAKGYTPGQVGYVCPHIARAILDHLPADASPEWTPTLREFLSDMRKVHVENLR